MPLPCQWSLQRGWTPLRISASAVLICCDRSPLPWCSTPPQTPRDAHVHTRPVGINRPSKTIPYFTRADAVIQSNWLWIQVRLRRRLRTSRITPRESTILPIATTLNPHVKSNLHYSHLVWIVREVDLVEDLSCFMLNGLHLHQVRRVLPGSVPKGQGECSIWDCGGSSKSVVLKGGSAVHCQGVREEFVTKNVKSKKKHS